MNAVVEVNPNDVVVNQTDDINPTFPTGISPLVAMLATGQLRNEHIEQAMLLQKQHEEYEAKKAFSSALSKFRKLAPKLRKDRQVDYKTQKGRTAYSHTSLGYALTQVNPVLGECDLNLSWHPRQDNGLVYVVTRLTHTQGFYEEIELNAAPDGTGNKNAIQAVSSTMTYLERIGAFALLGLASEHDDDGYASSSVTDDVPTQPTGMPAYSQERFEEMWPKWVALIKKGQKTALTIITQLNNGYSLSQNQMAKVMTLGQYEPLDGESVVVPDSPLQEAS